MVLTISPGATLQLAQRAAGGGSDNRGADDLDTIGYPTAIRIADHLSRWGGEAKQIATGIKVIGAGLNLGTDGLGDGFDMTLGIVAIVQLYAITADAPQ